MGPMVLLPLSQKTRESNRAFADVITEEAVSPQFFKDPGCWPGQVLFTAEESAASCLVTFSAGTLQ